MTITCHTIKLVPKMHSNNSRRSLTLTRAYQLKYLGYLKLIGSGYNWCHWSPIRWDPCGALNLDVQDVYANGCTVNGTVQSTLLILTQPWASKWLEQSVKISRSYWLCCLLFSMVSIPSGEIYVEFMIHILAASNWQKLNTTQTVSICTQHL